MYCFREKCVKIEVKLNERKIMAEEKKVIIYSTDWCAFCKQAEKFLDTKNVAWVDYDIEKDARAHDELMEKIGGNFRGVPVIDVDGEIILGFDRPRLLGALKASGMIAA